MFASIAGAAEYAVFKSKDRGRSWSRSDTGMPHGSRINGFGSLDEAVFAGTDSGIFISRDEARSWQPVTGNAMSSGRIISFATLGRKVFAGTDGSGILVSADKGQSWIRNTAFPSKHVRCLLTHKGKLYAGTDTDGVFASEDGGQVWTPLQNGLPEHAQVFGLSGIEGKLFAGLYAKGLYAWQDQEHRWTKVGPVTPLVLASTGGTLVAGHNPGGLYWSGNLGISWSKGSAAPFGQFTSGFSDNSGELSADAAIWELAANEELVFAGAASGVYYSEDRGRTWARARTGLPRQSPGVSFLLKPTFILAGTWITGDTGERLKR